MDVNYKNNKRYKTAKYPLRQPLYLMGLIRLLSGILLTGKKHTVDTADIKGLKPPYLLLSNHHSFIDFELVAEATFPHRVNNVVNIDGYYRRPWLMEWIGAICTRKFTSDLHLVKSIRRVLERGDILCMYPEARYSPCGTTSYLPDSLGKIIRMNKVPVVVAIHHGNHLHSPVWNVKNKRKLPLRTTFKQILTAEQAATLSVDEINAVLKEAFVYDDYRYQLENHILIDEPRRAEGLHKVLYQCPHCKAESRMNSRGAELFCEACGKRWTLLENGTLQAQTGDTEFPHVPDWFAWEREQVRREVRSGQYHFEDEVEVYSLPRCWKYEPLGTAALTHDSERGLILEGFYNGAPFTVHRTPLETNSLHVEYDFPALKQRDCVDISTANDSFYCFPKESNVITKLAFATEETYTLHREQKRMLKSK